MNAPADKQHSDARLWLVAVLVSLVVNVGALLVLAFLVLSSLIFQSPERTEPKPPEESTVLIVPIPPPEPAAEAQDAAGARRFARTSAEQQSEAPVDAPFIGERNTRATSDAAPVDDAPEMPSIKGREPDFAEIETTESRYQDGELDDQSEAATSASESAPMVEPSPPGLAEEIPAEEPAEAADEPEPSRDVLAEGPFPVDRPVTERDDKSEIGEQPKPAEQRDREASADAGRPEIAELPKPERPAAAGDPGFRGFQRKTELKGSISRRGQAALDVEDSPLGRYHADLSRAIERSWQRKVVQNRDYITPGVIRVRVVLDPAGKVRSVGTVDEFGIGLIQRGFTLGSIREAELPSMPAEVKRDLDGEPLELLYNFIF